MGAVVGPTAEWAASQDSTSLYPDLVRVAQEQLRFLRAGATWQNALAVAGGTSVREFPGSSPASLAASAVRNAIRRYKSFWLPLLNEVQSKGAMAVPSARQQDGDAGSIENLSLHSPAAAAVGTGPRGGPGGAASFPGLESHSIPPPPLKLPPGESSTVTVDDLVPPLDVHWIWHCHRLCPEAYARECSQRFGQVLDCSARLLTDHAGAYPLVAAPGYGGGSPASSRDGSGTASPTLGSKPLCTFAPGRRPSLSEGFLKRTGSAEGRSKALPNALALEGVFPPPPRTPLGGSFKDQHSAAGEWGPCDPEEAAAALSSAAAALSRRLWAMRFPSEPYDAFLLPPALCTLPEGRGQEASPETEDREDESGREYDLVAASIRQLNFVRQVLPPPHSLVDEEYLKGSVVRYKAFLALVKDRVKTGTSAGGTGGAGGAGAQEAVQFGVPVRLVPPLDVDFIWHCHQLCTKEYRQDCTANFGVPVSHDDSLGGAAASAQAISTAELWESKYRLPYARAGAFPRGPKRQAIWAPKNVAGAQKLPKSATEPGGGSRPGSASSASNRSVPSPGGRSPGVSASGSFNSPSFKDDAPAPPPPGVPPRHTMELYLRLHGVLGFTSGKGELFVRLLPLLHGSGIELSSAKLACTGGATAMSDKWLVAVDKVTQGLKVQVCAVGGGLIKSMRYLKVVAEGQVLWKDVMGSPGYLFSASLPLTCLVSQHAKDPHLALSISATAPTEAPALLCLQPAPPTDDSGYQLSAAVSAATKTPQEGKWLSFAVVDHSQEEQFLLRLRMAKGAGTKAVEVPPEAKRVVLHQGCWQAGSKAKVPCAAGKKLEEVWQLTGSSMGSTRTWMASSGWSVTIAIAPAEGSGKGSRPNMRCTFHKVPGAPLALVPGRWLQYGTPGADPTQGGDDSGYATLIRYPPEEPIGIATALLNWKTGAVEVAGGERWALVLMLAVVICHTWFDVVVKERKKGLSAKAVKRVVLPKDDEQGAVVSLLSELATEKIGRKGEGAPDPWFTHPTFMWNGVQVYNEADVAGSCALELSIWRGT